MSKEVKVVKKKRGRGRPKGSRNKSTIQAQKRLNKKFDPSSIKITKGNELNFSDDIFIPMKTNQDELDTIFSTAGGLMPATNMVIAGGPGSGKTTITLDILARLTSQGKKCLFVSGEMDQIGYYKMCQRLPSFQEVPVIFLKDHSEEIENVMNHVLDEGYDVVVIDSMAEILGMYRDVNKSTMKVAETWLINLQDSHKLGENRAKKHTTFINIQQVNKDGVFAGSNRLKHMTDSFATIEVDHDEMKRTLTFSKNRDGDKMFSICFSFYGTEVFYSYETIV